MPDIYEDGIKIKLDLSAQKILSIVYTVGYFIILYAYMVILPESEVKLTSDIAGVVNILIGILTAEIPRVNAFWFGSSFGSKVKSHKGVMS